MKNTSKLIIWIILVFPTVLFAQNECSELLQYGIYNHFQTSENVSSYSKMKSALQTVYSQYQEDKTNGKVKASYKLFSGGASYGHDQIESLYKMMNSRKMTENDFNQNFDLVQATIDPHILNAYNECKKLSSSSGLKIKASMSPDNVSAITFDIHFRDKWSGPTPKVKGLETKSVNGTADCFTCEGDLTEIAVNQESLNISEEYSLTCYRKKLSTPRKTYDGKYLIAEEGIIKIKTTMGNYTLWVPAVEQKREISRNVGEIVASMLSENEFLYLRNGENWVLADGREIGTNNSYYQITGRSKVPDLRGVFLRGKNHRRNVNDGNVENKELGQYQRDAFQGHHHKSRADMISAVKSGKVEKGGTVGGSVDAWNSLDQIMHGYGEDTNKSGNPRVAKETRPKNVTVNYFIKIN